MGPGEGFGEWARWMGPPPPTGYPRLMVCAFCRSQLIYVHGHAACGASGCPMFGVNQAECCSGETAACGPLTAEVHGSRRLADPPSPEPSKRS